MTDHSAEQDYYCPACQHPIGYHAENRGCTMPLDRAGLPVMRTAETVGACGCHASSPGGRTLAEITADSERMADEAEAQHRTSPDKEGE